MTYALDNYNLSKSLCWGNCWGHLQKTCEGPLLDRVVHLVIALFEAIPIIGQIISLFEQYIVQNYYTPSAREAYTPPAQEAIVYMPMTGNPTHLGHMSAINNSINEVRRQGFVVKQAFAGLSSQEYLQTKNASIELNFPQRKEFTMAAIEDAHDAGMFKDVSVWVLEEPEGSDHPDVYHKLDQKEKARNTPRTVILAAGGGLARKMNNWKDIPFAVIVERTGASSQPLPPIPPNTKRWKADTDPRYVSVSSTTIRAGDLTGLGARGQALWRSIFPQQAAA